MSALEWNKLGFEYLKTAGHMQYRYSNGKWDTGTVCVDDTVTLPISAVGMHYGQLAFEGLKAFRNANGEIRVLRPQENAKRLNTSLKYILAPELPETLFLDALTRLIKVNESFVPPCESKGSLYIRPIVMGTSPKMGVGPSEEYLFLMMAMPVGEYYKNGLQAVDSCIMDGFDRAAPYGTGHIKVAGNYAAGLYASKKAKEAGYPIALFLDAQTRENIEEFATSNFIAITKDGTYVTPNSHSVLPSITNDSLRILAEKMGIKVEQRVIHESELNDFAEVAACGTAVVLTPIRSITHNDKVYRFTDGCGPICKKLYDAYTAIQYGYAPDEFNWLYEIK